MEIQLNLTCPFATAADFPEATLRFANYYGDHMVLQRAPHSANVWGFMPACDDKVEVTFGEKMYNAMLNHGELVCIVCDMVVLLVSNHIHCNKSIFLCVYFYICVSIQTKR